MKKLRAFLVKSMFASIMGIAVLDTSSLCAAVAPLAPGSRYVAMGSSFAAGPGIGHRAPGSPNGCGRSASNYAHLLAQRLSLALTDVSCSGATTADILSRRQFGLPLQIDAVDASTRLVTITIGGNDVSYLGNIIAEACHARYPASPRCHRTENAEVERVFAELTQRITAVVVATRERAPNATIVLVDYFTILPAHGACEPLLPLSAAQIDAGRIVARRLAKITAKVANANKALLVKLSTLSAAHDVCARDPWIAGYEPLVSDPDFRTPPYHPNEQAMAAAASEIERKLSIGRK